MLVTWMQPSDRDVLDRIAKLTDSDVNWNTELSRACARIWVARCGPDDSEPVGFLLAWAVADELHVMNVATHPDARRLGAGGALMRALVEHAKIERVRLLLLEVRRSNRVAIRLYRGHGFRPIGVRSRYYADNAEDAIEMMLAFDPQTGSVVSLLDEIQLAEG